MLSILETRYTDTAIVNQNCNVMSTSTQHLIIHYVLLYVCLMMVHIKNTYTSGIFKFFRKGFLIQKCSMNNECF